MKQEHIKLLNNGIFEFKIEKTGPKGSFLIHITIKFQRKDEKHERNHEISERSYSVWSDQSVWSFLYHQKFVRRASERHQPDPVANSGRGGIRQN